VGWLVIDQDERQSVADGPLMTGSDTQTTDEFTQERSWTIKPLE
jgi:hypothetical protein